MGNLPRVLPDGRPRRDRLGGVGAAAGLRAGSRRHVDEEELRRVFNLGIGYCAVVPAPAGDELVIGRIEARDRRARLRRGHEPAGADRRRAADRRRRLEPRRASRRSSARAAPAIAAAIFALGDYPDRDARDLAMADWLEEQRRATSSSAPATCSCCTPASSSASRNRIVNVHPSLLPAFPGARRDRGRARRRRRDDRRHRAPRRRGRRHRAGAPPGARAGASRARPRRCTTASRRSSTGCCPRWYGSCSPAACRSTGGRS